MSYTVAIAQEGYMVGVEALPTILEVSLHAPPPNSSNFVQSRGLAMFASIHMSV